MPSVSVNISDPKNFPFGLIFFQTRNEKLSHALSVLLFLISSAPLMFSCRFVGARTTPPSVSVQF